MPKPEQDTRNVPWPGPQGVKVWERDRRVRELGYTNYADYIHSVRWYETRRRYRASDRPQDCQLCGGDKQIALHHLTYERVGNERLDDLLPLCNDCHQLVHALAARGAIDGIDLAALKPLVDEARAERNRTAMAEQNGVRRAEFAYVHANRSYAKRRQSLLRKLDDAVRRALKSEVDADSALDEVEREIERVTAELHERINAELEARDVPRVQWEKVP